MTTLTQIAIIILRNKLIEINGTVKLKDEIIFKEN